MTPPRRSLRWRDDLRAVDTGPVGSALGHVTICDLSGQLAGVGSTRYLAAFGARVVRVEDPVRQGRWASTPRPYSARSDQQPQEVWARPLAMTSARRSAT